jgi:hypothetical protein
MLSGHSAVQEIKHLIEFGYLIPVFKKIYSFSVSMVRRRISEAQRWQIIRMHTTGMSFKATGRPMGYHYNVVSRLVRKHTQTNNVKDLPRSGMRIICHLCASDIRLRTMLTENE